jgi:hypothetical protein
LPTPLETEISELLISHGDTVSVADELIARLRKNILNEEERADCFRFFKTAGLFSKFFSQIELLLSLQRSIPWGLFREALAEVGLQPEETDFQALVEAAREKQGLADLAQSLAFENQSTSLADLRREVNRQRHSDLEKRKATLQNKLNYVRTNRLFAQEAEILKEMQALFPDLSDIDEEGKAFRLRWAREILDNSDREKNFTAELIRKSETLPHDQRRAKDLIIERARELASENPQLAYDLAVSLHMMDMHREALETLQHAAASPAAEWLRLELLVQSRQYVAALEEANRMEIAYANDPNASFSATYARARSLHGLGQQQPAIELLRSLVRIRPHYKSAQTLLSDWTGGNA